MVSLPTPMSLPQNGLDAIITAPIVTVIATMISAVVLHSNVIDGIITFAIVAEDSVIGIDLLVKWPSLPKPPKSISSSVRSP